MTDDERSKWDDRYEKLLSDDSSPEDALQPHSSLVSLRPFLPDSGRLIDAGGGFGRNAIWAAKQGFHVTLADISRHAIELAERNAVATGVELTGWCVDFDDAEPNSRWDVLLSINFLHRRLYTQPDLWLEPGGIFVLIQPTYENLLRHERPSRRYLTSIEEMEYCFRDHEVLHLDAGWKPNGQHLLELVARISSAS